MPTLGERQLGDLDDETRDVSAAELAAALPFSRPAAKSRIGGALDPTSHARLAARLVAAPHEAMADLAALGLADPEARARADAEILAVLATDPLSARAWVLAFEAELSRF